MRTLVAAAYLSTYCAHDVGVVHGLIEEEEEITRGERAGLGTTRTPSHNNRKRRSEQTRSVHTGSSKTNQKGARHQNLEARKTTKHTSTNQANQQKENRLRQLVDVHGQLSPKRAAIPSQEGVIHWHRRVRELPWQLVAVRRREVMEVAPEPRCRQVGDRREDVEAVSEDARPQVCVHHIVRQAVAQHLQAIRPRVRPVMPVPARPQEPAAMLHGVNGEAGHKVPHSAVNAWVRWR